MAKVVGLTGGIGAGKSICARVFELLGVPIYNSDAVAKYLMSTDPALKEGLLKLFGHEAYNKDGQLNRSYLSRAIFTNKDLLQQMNALVHPAVGHHFLSWAEENKHSPYLIYESAILIETGTYKRFDKIILVDAPEEIRIERVVKRDNTDDEHVRQLIKNQLDSTEKRKHADFIIENDDKHSIIYQILGIHRQLVDSSN